MSTGGKFTGDWIKGLQDFGVYKNKGKEYIGHWQGGRKANQGYLKDLDEEKVWKGQIEDDEFITGDMLNERTGKRVIKKEVVNKGKNTKIVTRIETEEFVYEGDIFEEVEHGYGIKKWKDGTEYKGNWKDGEQCGKGEYIRPAYKKIKAKDQYGAAIEVEQKFSEDHYKGNFKNNKFHGYGDVTWANGNQHVGYFENGLYHGFGKTTYKTENTEDPDSYGKVSYEGELKRGLYHGPGKMVYFSGDLFEGDFIKGKRQGKGKITFKTKRDMALEKDCFEEYDGDWFNDKYEGYGTFTHSIKGI